MSDFLIGGFKTIKQREIQAVRGNAGIAAAGRVCKTGARCFHIYVRECGMKATLPLTLSFALLATMAVASLAAWLMITSGAELAVHFGFDGTPNRYAPAPFALSIIPAAALVSTIIFTLGPRLDRKTSDKPVLYAALWLFVIVVLAAGHALIVGHALSAN